MAVPRSEPEYLVSGPTSQPYISSACQANRGNPTPIAPALGYPSQYYGSSAPSAPSAQSAPYLYQDVELTQSKPFTNNLFTSYPPFYNEYDSAIIQPVLGIPRGGPVLNQASGDGNEINEISVPSPIRQQGSKRPGDPPERRGSDKKQKRAGPFKHRFACPFFIRDREAHRCCLDFTILRLCDVRLHINRKHAEKIHCADCGKLFDNDPDKRDEHSRARCCEPREFNPPWATRDQLDKMKRAANGSSNLTDEERWFQIWDIMFPGVTQPSSPYIYAPFHGLEIHLRDAMDSYQQEGLWQQHWDTVASSASGEHLTAVRDISSVVLRHFASYLDTWMKRRAPRDEVDDSEAVTSDIWHPSRQLSSLNTLPDLSGSFTPSSTLPPLPHGQAIDRTPLAHPQNQFPSMNPRIPHIIFPNGTFNTYQDTQM
ncbi:hypothetical protein F4820DRAFT_464059 [Hypoxylon rubiginosum]|uniref:Uncharacterized protein n=1 Tax=Hypoxylon rubiginosum TaxID=110542 RepID=A0ACB9YSX0_9PEZI|nr:hypothetical protein F4820DRAFT_464059 [Hypoxylon rubiginosum]